MDGKGVNRPSGLLADAFGQRSRLGRQSNCTETVATFFANASSGDRLRSIAVGQSPVVDVDAAFAETKPATKPPDDAFPTRSASW